ncbi:MAG TPA: leucyl aminopeptidase [Steroidobacteraceae bacterium]|nr:leucyl aminopeptidase [Steroidobacteraceae bacterium]HVP32412.1 leucyl aminopeptidase [Steroidobacteraceae bacterium]
MEFGVWTKGLATLAVDCLVVGVFEESELGAEARAVDAACGGRLQRLLTRGDFAGRAGDTLLITEVTELPARRVLLVGLGARKQLARRSWRRAWASALTALARTRIASVALALDRPAARELDDYYFGRAVAELAGATLYRINDLKTGKKPPAPALKQVLAGPVRKADAAARGFKHGAAIAAAAAIQRDLANLPANVCTPTYLAEEARALAKRHKSLTARVLDEAAIRRERMGCLLAVSQGSRQPPRFIVLEHRGGKAAQPPVVLVGKGVTFDTGGISLKDPPGMDEMKFDMSGAAAVIACLTLAAELRLPLHIVGLVAAVENMPGGKAVKPGDIATSASGQTVEILNTDAEGRLILCDALHYARRFRPAAVVDIATLTGACVVALGHHHSGLMGNDEALIEQLREAGVRADDRCWQLPLTEDYAEQLKSNFADFANIGGRDGGAITAAAFLGKFTQGLAWAHLDVAGTAYQGGAQKGSTGRPTPLLADFLIRRAER